MMMALHSRYLVCKAANLKQLVDSNPEQRPSKTISCFDGFTKLPNEMLQKIISFLPTKNAVATSILSKRWKDINPFGVLPIHLLLDNFEFIDGDNYTAHEYGNCHGTCSFFDFVDKLFNETLLNVPCVDKLTLRCGMPDTCGDKMEAWVSAALRLNVKALTLIFCRPDATYVLSDLNKCTTLVSLCLANVPWDYRPTTLNVPYDFSLPSLKVLCVHGYHCGSISELVNGCPMLEELDIIHCSFEHGECLRIQSPKLKCLYIEEMCYLGESMELNFPNLEVFTFNASVLGDFVSTFKSLTEAHIDFHSTTNGHGVRNPTNFGEIINACSSTKCLYISCRSITDLHSSNVQLPQFHNLTRLSLDCVNYDGWALFTCLLKNAPKLEHLTFEEELKDAEFENFEDLVPSSPTCLELQLKSIEFKHFEWNNVVKVLNYFVQNGKLLEKVVLNSVVLPLPVRK